LSRCAQRLVRPSFDNDHLQKLGDNLAGGYTKWFTAAETLQADLSPDEKQTFSAAMRRASSSQAEDDGHAEDDSLKLLQGAKRAARGLTPR
jgi:hypothetical protein